MVWCLRWTVLPPQNDLKVKVKREPFLFTSLPWVSWGESNPELSQDLLTNFDSK